MLTYLQRQSTRCPKQHKKLVDVSMCLVQLTLLVQAEVPPGVFNMIMGDGPNCGEAQDNALACL